MAQQAHEVEVKQILDRQQLTQLLHQWLDSLEAERDFKVVINNETYVVPTDAPIIGETEVEYEIDKGEFEFQLTLKWR